MKVPVWDGQLVVAMAVLWVRKLVSMKAKHLGGNWVAVLAEKLAGLINYLMAELMVAM
jgi:hypothetical protein